MTQAANQIRQAAGAAVQPICYLDTLYITTDQSPDVVTLVDDIAWRPVDQGSIATYGPTNVFVDLVCRSLGNT